MSILNIKQWDPQKFNKDFDNYINEVKEKNKKEEAELSKNNELYIKKNIFDYSIKEFLIEWKYTILNIINEVLHFNINKKLITDNNNMFFIGFTILFCIIMYIIISNIISSIILDNNTYQRKDIKKVVYEFK